MRLLTLTHRETGVRITVDGEPQRDGSLRTAVMLYDADGTHTTVAAGWASLANLVTVLDQTRRDYAAPAWEEPES